MAQLQLPIFPSGVTEINRHLAVQTNGGMVYYFHGPLPVFSHAKNDVRGFRMFTSQLIVNGTAKPKEIVQAFGVPMVTVKRYVKVFRERGSGGFYEVKPRHSSASVLRGEVLDQVQQMFDAGQSIPEVAAELKILNTTLHKAVAAGRLRQSK
jgi:transposase